MEPENQEVIESVETEEPTGAPEEVKNETTPAVELNSFNLSLLVKVCGALFHMKESSGVIIETLITPSNVSRVTTKDSSDPLHLHDGTVFEFGDVLVLRMSNSSVSYLMLKNELGSFIGSRYQVTALEDSAKLNAVMNLPASYQKVIDNVSKITADINSLQIEEVSIIADLVKSPEDVAPLREFLLSQQS